VNGHTRFFITRTHPEIVGGDAHTACTPKLVAIGFSASSKAASTSLDTALHLKNTSRVAKHTP
jgi:hypothetical protein